MKRHLLKSITDANTVTQTPMPWARGPRRNAMIARRSAKLGSHVKLQELKQQRG